MEELQQADASVIAGLAESGGVPAEADSDAYKPSAALAATAEAVAPSDAGSDEGTGDDFVQATRDRIRVVTVRMQRSQDDEDLNMDSGYGIQSIRLSLPKAQGLKGSSFLGSFL